MKISGFTMVRNATKYYFPIKESIQSVLPIVDEFIVALGDCDPDDHTRAEIEALGSDKVKIYERVWSEQAFVDGRIFAEETTFALSQCQGDWCLYLQADEVIHEQDLPLIQARCTDNLARPEVEGFLFDYYHFFGDYEHFLPFHGWYQQEIRIVRNHIGVYSHKDAQSFRKGDGQKLRVLPIQAHIYHYGWVRPPHLMQSKKKEQDSMHHGREQVRTTYQTRPDMFDYGALGRLPQFEGSHPRVMEAFRARLDWRDQLNYTRQAHLTRAKMKHERLKYRLITRLEQALNGGKALFGYRNWRELKPRS